MKKKNKNQAAFVCLPVSAFKYVVFENNFN